MHSHLMDKLALSGADVCRGGHTQFVQAGAEASDTSAEVVKPDPHCSWKGHSRRVGADVGDESAESCRVVDYLSNHFAFHW